MAPGRHRLARDRNDLGVRRKLIAVGLPVTRQPRSKTRVIALSLFAFFTIPNSEVCTGGCLRLFEALLPCVAKLLRPQVLEEIERFRRWRQEKVAKIVQC